MSIEAVEGRGLVAPPNRRQRSRRPNGTGARRRRPRPTALRAS